MKTKVLTVRLPPTLFERLNKDADSRNQLQSEFVRDIFRKYYENQEQEASQIQELKDQHKKSIEQYKTVIKALREFIDYKSLTDEDGIWGMEKDLKTFLKKYGIEY
jgi:metal-responsive CopG/Arc/MetJ family transcriptional regulator